MKVIFLSAFVVLTFSVPSVFGLGLRRRNNRIIFQNIQSSFILPALSGLDPQKLSLELKQVSSPEIKFHCGHRDSSRHISDGISPFVLGGREAPAHSWPWMVLLGRRNGLSNIYFCSGVLITKQHVLTAAHCVLDLTPFFARLGEHDYSDSSDDSKAPEDVSVQDVIFHPKYDVREGYSDVAILKLTRPVTLRSEIQAICLPWGSTINEDLVNQKVTVTGWGTVEFGGLPSRVLQEVKIDVFDPSVCHKSYSTLGDFMKAFPKGMNRENIVCAGAILGGKDACQGDSGGPMVHESPDRSYTLAGIISKGYGCGKAGFPGLYTPIRNYDTLTWIKRTAF